MNCYCLTGMRLSILVETLLAGVILRWRVARPTGNEGIYLFHQKGAMENECSDPPFLFVFRCYASKEHTDENDY